MSNDFTKEALTAHLDSLKNRFKEKSIDAIIERLPEILKTPCQYLVDEVEKEVFLIGALGVISGILPNIKGNYAGKWISPNLYVYVLGGYGSGKGGLDFARDLGKQIQESKSEQLEIANKQYEAKEVIYKKKLKEYNKSKDLAADPPKKPKRPPLTTLFIPSNNSKSGLYQLLQENKNTGILFETEGDTLAEALKQDFGGFSDTLRKAFHHEYLDFFRRGNNEFVKITDPKLSVILSSTFDQLKTLIPSDENGLFSRFLYYELKQNNEFANVFDDRKANYSELFNDAGSEFKRIYDTLEPLQKPVFFALSYEQQKTFVKLFNIRKTDLIKSTDVTMAGTANRLGIIAFRLMMLFTTLRAFENDNLKEIIYCNETDFNNALLLVDRFESHAKTVFDYLNQDPNKKTLVSELHKTGNSYRAISKAVWGDETHISTVGKWVNSKKRN